MSTMEHHPDFATWLETAEIPMTPDEENWASWKCGGGPHSGPQPQPTAENQPQSKAIAGETMVNTQPGVLIQRTDPVEKFRGNISDSTWQNFRKAIRETQEKRESLKLTGDELH